MITGWRRFFTRSYWRFQWLLIRTRGYPGDIRSVGVLEVPDWDEQPLDSETLRAAEAELGPLVLGEGRRIW